MHTIKRKWKWRKKVSWITSTATATFNETIKVENDNDMVKYLVNQLQNKIIILRCSESML